MSNDGALTSNQSDLQKTAQSSPEEKMPVAPNQEQHSEPAKVFISYSHEDLELRDAYFMLNNFSHIKKKYKLSQNILYTMVKIEKIQKA